MEPKLSNRSTIVGGSPAKALFYPFYDDNIDYVLVVQFIEYIYLRHQQITPPDVQFFIHSCGKGNVAYSCIHVHT